MKLNLLAFIMLFLSCDWALAQRQWEKTNGPYGAHVVSIVVSPDGRIYAGTIPGIYRSDDNGNSWIKLDGSPIGMYRSVYKLVVNEDGHIFALISGNGTGDHLAAPALFRSTDLGNTWELIFNLGDQIVIDSSGNIFIGGSSLYVSRDNGDTWILQNEIATYSLVLTSNDHLLAVFGNGIQMSTDDGSTWNYIGSPETYGMGIGPLVVNSRDDIFVETYSNVVRSTDNGSTWEPILDILFKGYIFINSNNDIFYSYFDKGIYRSTDNGNTWDIINEGLSDLFLSTIAFDSANNVYLGNGEGIFKSSNNGDQWISSNTGLNSSIPSLDINNEGDLFVARYYNLFRSNDKGANWKSIYQVQHDTVIQGVQIRDNGDIYIIEYESIFDTPWVNSIVRRSRDNGYTWDIIFVENQSEIRCLSFNEGKINIVTDDGRYVGLYVSTDDGKTFILQPESASFLCNTLILPSGTLIRPNLVYINDPPKSIIEKSIDNGVTWTQTIILDNPSLQGIQVKSNSSGHLYVSALDDYANIADTSFLLRSTDEGVRWDTVFFIDSVLIQKVYIDYLDNVYLATSRGIYFSGDKGDTWSTINEGLETTYVLDIQVDSSSGILYATPLGSGLWKNELMVSTKTFDTTPDFSVYPNPSAGIIILNLSGKMPSSTRLDIYNIQGMLVKSIPVMDSKSTIIVSDLLPGLYLINVSGLKKGQVLILN